MVRVAFASLGEYEGCATDIVSHLGNFNWFNWGGRITHKLYSFSSASPATLFL